MPTPTNMAQTQQMHSKGFYRSEGNLSEVIVVLWYCGTVVLSLALSDDRDEFSEGKFGKRCSNRSIKQGFSTCPGCLLAEVDPNRRVTDG